MNKVFFATAFVGVLVLLLGSTVNAQLFPPELETDPMGVRTVDFGEVAIGSTVEKSIMLTNPGGDTLTVTAIDIAGTNPEDFQVITALPFSIKGDDTEKFELKISFKPTAGGERIAKLTLNHNAWDETTDFTIKGTSTAPVFAASPDSLDFGEVPLGTSVAKVITVSNTGSAPLDVTAINITGTNVADFSVTAGTAPFAIGAGESVDVEITFLPQDGGERKADIEFVSNSSTTPDIVSVMGTSPQPKFSATPSTLDFPSIELGKSDTKLLTITNAGTVDLEITDISFIGANSGDFSFQTTLPITIVAGGTFDLTVTFTPAEIGDRSAALEFMSNSADSPDMVAITGICAAAAEETPVIPEAEPKPVFEVDQPMVTFGEVEMGLSASLSVTVTNSGDANLDVTELKIAGTNPADFTIADGKAPFILAPGESQNIIITFEPKEEGAEVRSAMIEFIDNTDTTDSIDLSGSVKGVTGTDDPKIDEVPDVKKDYNDNQINGPMAFYSHMNGFYGVIGYGRMEGTHTLPEGSIFAQLDFHLSSTGAEYNDNPDYDATLTYIELCGRYGILDGMGLEAGLRLRFGGWDGTITAPGLAPNSEGGTSLGDMFLDVKFNPIKASADLPYSMAALLVLKLPVGSTDDALSSGNLDLSLNLLNSYFLMDNKLAIHMMLGFTMALDSDEVYESTLKWGFLLNFGIGASYTIMDSETMKFAVMWQIEFYDPNLDMSLGGRMDILVGGMHLKPEIGFTIGLQELSNAFGLHIAMGILF